jgi:hypothetical protein
MKKAKIVPLRNAAAASDDRLIVTLDVAALREIICQEIERAAQPKPDKLLYTTQEAAAMLSLKPSWIAARARNGLVPCTRKGHYILFTKEQVQQIADKSEG